jgi:Na+/proline symporter
MLELFFLLGFTLHNIEEALWLPRWSRYAKKYHKEVGEKEFRFSVIVITAVGYLITLQHLVFGPENVISQDLFLGFVLVMVCNVIFPHLSATIVLRKYARGTLPGLLLTLPIGLYILVKNLESGSDLLSVAMVAVVMAIVFIFSMDHLFRAGRELLD